MCFCYTGLFAAKRVLSSIASRSKDAWFLKLLYARPASEALLAQQEENQLHVTDRVAYMIAEHIGTIHEGWICTSSVHHSVIKAYSAVVAEVSFYQPLPLYFWKNEETYYQGTVLKAGSKTLCFLDSIFLMTIILFFPHTTGISVASIVICVANVEGTSGTAQSQLVVWSTFALAQVVSALEGFILWGIASCIHQMDLSLLWHLRSVKSTAKIMFPLITFIIMDTVLRLFSIISPKQVNDGGIVLGLYPHISLF